MGRATRGPGGLAMTVSTGKMGQPKTQDVSGYVGLRPE